MAYTNSPTNTTYRTVELPFTATEFKRSNSFTERRDPHIINMFYDVNSNQNKTQDFFLVKRPGLEDSTIPPQLSVSTNQSVIGSYFNEANNEIYWATSERNVYYLDLSVGIGSLQTIATFTNTRWTVGFTTFLNSSGTRYLIFTNGDELFYMNMASPGAATEVTDAQLPTPHIAMPVFLDGYLFLATSGGDVYNSDLDDMSAWTPGNYISAEISGDGLTGLVKVKNYIVALGRRGIEFFYDAANLSGSPLGRNESYYKAISVYDGISQVGDDVFFVGAYVNQGLRVFRLRENDCTPVSDSTQERILGHYSALYTRSQPSTANAPRFKGNTFSVAGHNFYLLSVARASSPFGQINFVLDTDLGFWYEWNLQNARVDSVINSSTGKPMLALSRLDTGTGNYIAWSDFVYLNPNTYNDTNFDTSLNFTTIYITEEFDGETFNNKVCGRVAVLCDQYQSTGTSNLALSWSDDNGASYSTPRNINVFSHNPFISATGRFRSRLWKLEYTDNYPLRLKGLSMDLNIGTN